MHTVGAQFIINILKLHLIPSHLLDYMKPKVSRYVSLEFLHLDQRGKHQQQLDIS